MGINDERMRLPVLEMLLDQIHLLVISLNSGEFRCTGVCTVTYLE